MKFKYYRFTLAMTENFDWTTEEVGREKIIEEIFSKGKKYNFKIKNSTYGFLIKSVQEKKALGRIAKKTSTKLHGPPEDEFKEKQEEDWPGCHVFINLDNEKETGKKNDYGQLIAWQSKPTAISNPFNCLSALAQQINNEFLLKKHSNYHMYIKPILDTNKGFWSIVDKHHDEIKKITFNYNRPNLLELDDDLDSDLKKLYKQFNSTNVEFSLENKQGGLRIPKENKLLQQSAERADKGEADFKIETKEKKILSEESVRSEIHKCTEEEIEKSATAKLYKIIHDVLLGSSK